MKLQILQLKCTPELHYHRFSSLRMLEKFNLIVELKNYDVIYESNMFDDDEISISGLLENIFARFQGTKPEGYKGHSLSVSDIVKLNDRYWYCDSFGFEEIKF